MLSLRRISDEPIIRAGAVPGYGPVFNAGVIHHDGVFHLFARGVRDGYRRNTEPGARFLDYMSDVLVFTSVDGLEYTFQQVLAKSSVHSYENPRVQHVATPDGDVVVMSYTNLPLPASGKPWRVGVHRLGYADGRFYLNRTSGRLIGPATTPDKDAVVFNLRDGRVALIHRIQPNMQLAVFDSLDELWDAPQAYWSAHLHDLEAHTIIRPSPTALGVGAGAPPIRTPAGLLLFFHERDANGDYTAKVALLDDESGRVKAMLPDVIMRPELDWEVVGDVERVVFVQGAVERPDGTIYLTYGAADRCVGAATVAASEVVAALLAAA